MITYKVLPIHASSVSEAIRGPTISYLCAKCETLVPSQPDDNMGCSCGNIFLDIDSLMLIVYEWASFKIVEILD